MKGRQTLAAIANSQSSHEVREGRAVAVVAPSWLQDGLAVVIKAIPRMRLVACTGSVQSLLLIDLERAPDLIVVAVDAPDVKASNKIRQVKFVFPQARYLVLLQEPAQNVSARAAGADETLLQGASAEQFSAAVNRLIGSEQVE
jgi:DNA-binding NarL/FixJ family response regulator